MHSTLYSQSSQFYLFVKEREREFSSGSSLFKQPYLPEVGKIEAWAKMKFKTRKSVKVAHVADWNPNT